MLNPDNGGQTAPPAEPAQLPAFRRFDWALVALLLAILAVTGGGSWVFFDELEVAARAKAQGDQAAIADRPGEYGAFWRQARLVWGGLGVVTVTACLGVVLLGRRRDLRFLRQQLENDKEKRALAERVELLMRNANDSIVLADERWRVVDANARAVQSYGYAREELLGMVVRNLRAPETREKFDLDVTRLATSAYRIYETAHQRKDGTTFPVEISAKTVTIGGAPYNVAFIRDITERKAREREIERLNRLYATLSQINLTILRVKSRDELLRGACREAVEYGGFKLAWIGRHDAATQVVTPLAWAGEPQSFIHRVRHSSAAGVERGCLCGVAIREGRAAVANDLRQAPQMGQCQSEYEAAGLRSLAAFPLRLEGQIWGVFAVAASEANVFQDKEVSTLMEAAGDIAFGLETLDHGQQRKRAEEELRWKTAFLEAQVNSSLDGILVVDNQAKKILQNGRMTELLKIPQPVAGDTNDEQQIQFVAQTVKDPVKFVERVAYLNSHHTELSRDELELKDGTVLDRYSAPVLGSDGTHYGRIWTFRDITERKQLEAQLQQAQKLEGIGQLAGGVAHDFNNMLAIIGGNAELLLLSPGELSAESRECISHIASAAERAASLTRQLLIFSRKQVMQPQAVALNELIGNLTKMLKRVIREDIRLECAYGEPLPLVQADPGMVEQVVLNLVVNARDAMPRGGELHLATEGVRVGAAELRASPEARAGEFVCLSVRDTGSGIAPEVLPRIFEPFYTTKEIGKGTGLGLATVYGTVKQHGGWVEVLTEVGQGTTFRVFLPALAGPGPEAAAAAPVAEAPGAGQTILLVEDDFAVRLIMRRVLEKANYKVHEAATGQEALELWASHGSEIELLITDIVMPGGVNGRDVSEKLRAGKPRLKVIFMSGYSAEVIGQDSEFFRHTKSHFLHKPCPTDVLLRTVRQCLLEP